MYDLDEVSEAVTRELARLEYQAGVLEALDDGDLTEGDLWALSDLVVLGFSIARVQG